MNDRLLGQLYDANNRNGPVEAIPAQLAGLVAWGESADLGADGSTIASWTNRTGSGIDPAQATSGLRPTVVASAINGRKAAKFVAASSQRLAFPAGALNWFSAVNGATLLAVVQPLSAPAATGRILNVEVSGSTVGRVECNVTSGPAYMARSARVTADTQTVISGGIPAVGTPAIVGSIFDYQTGAGQLQVNGATVSTGTLATTGASATETSNGIVLGGTSAGAALFDGYIGAYALWTAAYSRAQLDPILRRWARIYGLTLAG